MRIGELSRRTGISTRMLRYYEEQGLLRPQRRSSGYREYSAADAALAGKIRCLATAGLPTATIASILPCLREDAGHLVPTCPDLLGDLRAERARIEGEIDELRTSRAVLDAILTAAPSG